MERYPHSVRVDGRRPSRRAPRGRGKEGLTGADLCNAFLTARLRKVEAGELSAGRFTDYRTITVPLVGSLGSRRFVDDLVADDFAALRTGVHSQERPVGR
ncbi:unnamed protein product [Gemmata massiliana]|uniref:Uncharacterized protein n=1 Tax=Gemmata massiliana TaxID=1210884 RepID=A0A6P2DKB3_9BACT|nr:hypothetical protein [Gemmata massiliana]VTS00993.1 unnamed protein product [Gemmata massiliana]